MQAKADALKPTVTPREQLRIELHSLQLQAGLNGDAAQGSAYLQALDRALQKYPSDVQLLLLRGNAAEPYAAGIGQLGGAESIKYYERVLEIEPDSAAAHHFLAHSYENTGDMASALKHAEAYQKLAPSSPHAHHMYGHGLRHSSQVEKAISEFKLARELAERQYSGELSTIIYDWDYRHNLSLLGAAYVQVGSLANAEKTFSDLAQLPATNAQDELYAGQFAAFLLRSGKRRDAISAAEHLQQKDSAVSRLFASVIAGNAYLDLGQTALASQQAAIADEVAKATDPAWRYQIASWLDLLHLRLDAAAGHRDKLTERLNKLCLVPVLPSLDSWSETLLQLEYIGRIARDMGDWNAAAFAANRMLAYAPQYKGTHLALASIARHDGNKTVEERELKLAGRGPTARTVTVKTGKPGTGSCEKIRRHRFSSRKTGDRRRLPSTVP
jgi:tetratricopeptide (TPR) repeat protein